jgi:hypothetical protein
MTVSEIKRDRAPQLVDERETLGGVLDFLRATVVNKVAGLTGEQARSTPVLPSTMTPIGLVKHLTAVERWWFSIDFAVRPVTPPWPDGESFDGFELSGEDTLESVVEGYLAECEASRDVVRVAGLDDPARGEGMAFNLRYALTHMIEETARHCGHLDLMREVLDGKRGQ